MRQLQRSKPFPLITPTPAPMLALYFCECLSLLARTAQSQIAAAPDGDAFTTPTYFIQSGVASATLCPASLQLRR
jgi:hypothetical protein